MRKADQKRFIKNAAHSALDQVLRAIKNNSIPESWDGTELRQYLSDLINRPNDMEPKRREAYRDVVRKL